MNLFFNISATQEKRKILVELVQGIAAVITIPFTVGGGMKSVEEIDNLLEVGADKEFLGAGELLFTSIDRDGTKSDFDYKLLSVIHRCTNIPLIASGFAGRISHCIDAIKKGKADAVLAASTFYFREVKLSKFKLQMHEAGILCRII